MKEFIRNISPYFEDDYEIDNDGLKGYIQQMKRHEEAALKARLIQFGIDFDPEKEAKNRFPRLCVEHQYDKRIYWYNNGTPEGIRVMTIKYSFPKISPDGRRCTAELEIT